MGQGQPDTEVALSMGQDSLGKVEGDKYNPLVQVRVWVCGWGCVGICGWVWGGCMCVCVCVVCKCCFLGMQDFLLKLPGINSKNYRYVTMVFACF